MAVVQPSLYLWPSRGSMYSVVALAVRWRSVVPIKLHCRVLSSFSDGYASPCEACQARCHDHRARLAAQGNVITHSCSSLRSLAIANHFSHAACDNLSDQKSVGSGECPSPALFYRINGVGVANGFSPITHGASSMNFGVRMLFFV